MMVRIPVQQHSPFMMIPHPPSFVPRVLALTAALFVGASSVWAQLAPVPVPSPAAVPAPPAPVPVVPSPQAAPAPADGEAIFSAIVRVENQSWEPNYRVPWNSGGTGGGVGTGFLIAPNRFLTNAHVVSDSRLLYVKKVDDPKPYEAEIVHIAHDCDLALLALKDPSAFETVRPLRLGGVPLLNSTVIAVGYPIGGQRISVTRGVVSRIDFQSFAHSGVDFHLAIQVDAAINPGNSGGPVIQEGTVVGVAFQGYSGDVAQSTGFMIPVPVIHRFLEDVRDGTYDHYPDLAIAHFNLQNPAQRKALNLPNDGIGVMVSSADSAGSAGGLLQTGDIIVAMDGFPVSSDGFVNMLGSRVNMNEIVERKYVGNIVKLRVIRGGKAMDLDITLKRFLPYLIQANQYDQKPQYVVFAGLLFQPVDRNMMAAHGVSSLNVRYLFNFFSQDEVYKERPQIVVLTDILPDEINTHFDLFRQQAVDEINGKKIRSLKDVHQALQNPAPPGGFHVIRFLGEGRPMVIEASRVAAANQRVAEKYNVTEDHRIGDSVMAQ
jgi:S1-C subfamily serine protease